MALLKRKRAGLNDAMSVVTRFVNACNRHDADGVATCLHPDFDSIQPMYPARNFRGADQVRRNWQAIFDAEPGFRLTVLRSAAMDDTVWLELHGAGREAEVAGVFVMGVQGDRIRWARIYSALVEPVVAGMSEDATSGQHGNGEVVDGSALAPVLDMDRSSRRRRRRRSSVEAAVDAVTADVLISTPHPDPVAEPDIEGEGVDPGEPVEAVEVVEMVEVEPEVVVVVAGEEVDVVPAVEAVVADTDAAPAAHVAEPNSDEPVSDEPVSDEGPPTEAVEMSSLTDPDPEPETPVAGDIPAPAPPKRRFGRPRT